MQEVCSFWELFDFKTYIGHRPGLLFRTISRRLFDPVENVSLVRPGTVSDNSYRCSIRDSPSYVIGIIRPSHVLQRALWIAQVFVWHEKQREPAVVLFHSVREDGSKQDFRDIIRHYDTHLVLNCLDSFANFHTQRSFGIQIQRQIEELRQPAW